MNDRFTLKDYRNKHRICPKCKDYIDVFIIPSGTVDKGDFSNYKSNNSAQCLNCKWRGIEHDLLP